MTRRPVFPPDPPGSHRQHVDLTEIRLCSSPVKWLRHFTGLPFEVYPDQPVILDKPALPQRLEKARFLPLLEALVDRARAAERTRQCLPQTDSNTISSCHTSKDIKKENGRLMRNVPYNRVRFRDPAGRNHSAPTI